jgi:TolB-like protein/cytochrome c-type biogenesis protein CcmH/NrfG
MAVIAVAVVLGWMLWPRLPAVEGDTTPPRIVVLPFENLGPPEDEYFADGMTEEIISRLAAVSELHIISRTSALHYKGTNKTIRQIGEELGVDYALEGTVRWDRSGGGHGRVRITPQLIQVADDRHLWSERYDRVIEDIFEVQSGIAMKVIAQLHVTLLEPEVKALEARPTENIEAYNAYLSGMKYSGLPTQEDAKTAISMFERAVELDPDFALAHAHLSRLHNLAVYAGLVGGDRRRIAKQAADRALALDPGLPEAHGALALYYDLIQAYEPMMRHAETAERLRPNDPHGLLTLAIASNRHGRFQQEVALLERAAEIDPHNPEVLILLASDAYSYGRKHERAAETIERAIAVAPDLAWAYATRHTIYTRWYGPSPQSRRVLEEVPAGIPDLELSWFNQEAGEGNYEAALAWLENAPGVLLYGVPKSLHECFCYRALSQRERAREACEAALVIVEKWFTKSPNSPEGLKLLAAAYAGLGRQEEAVEVLEKAVELYPSVHPPAAKAAVAQLAWTYAGAGQLDAAMDKIEDLLSMPGDLTVAQLRLHPRWDPLRDHPRFQEILDKYDTEQ